MCDAYVSKRTTLAKLESVHRHGILKKKLKQRKNTVTQKTLTNARG